ncbi:MAG: UDP-N-acetylmuramoyl-L-alanyl-D-glutamate--2,6-diaminopimelate ligase [Planctomycetota bacterium]
MRLNELISGLPGVTGTTGPGPSEVRVSDLTADSRTAVPGSLFFAHDGSHERGSAFCLDAAARGAVALLIPEHAEDPLTSGSAESGAVCVVRCRDTRLAEALIAERFFGSPGSTLRLVGVTGTNGKTTVAHLVHQLVNAGGTRCGLIGTVLIDDGQETAPAEMTTPPASELSRTLAVMREHGCGAASMEVSSHALDQRRADGLRFAAAVFTNLTGEHLDYHGTMEAYAEAKSRLFSLIEPGHGGVEPGVAVINADDAHAEMMLDAIPEHSRVIRCTASPTGEFRDAEVTVLASDANGLRLRLTGPFGALETSVPLIGAHNAMNTLQACCAAHACGVPAEVLAARLPTLAPPPGRMERVPGPVGGPIVLVDYAHTDDALERAIPAARTALRDPDARLWIVFGAGGDRDRSKRPRMGEVASRLAQRVVVTSDNPRSEPVHAIIDEILAGVSDDGRHRVEVQSDRAQAIRHAIASAAAGDVVLIAGKGHETTQILPDGKGGTRTIAHDDHAVALESLRSFAGAGS